MAKNCQKISQNNVIMCKQMLEHMHKAVGYQLKDIDYTAKMAVTVMGKYRMRTVDSEGNCNEDCFDSEYLYRTIKMWFEMNTSALELSDMEWEWLSKGCLY